MGQGGAQGPALFADTAPPRLMPRLGVMHGVASRLLRVVSKASMLTCMTATIDIPDDLYRKLSARSAEQGRPVDAVAVDLLRQGLDEGVEAPTESVSQADDAWPQNWFRLADEIFKHAPPGPSTREILEQDRGRLD